MLPEPVVGLLQHSNSCAFSFSKQEKFCICARGWKFKHRPEEGSRFSGAGVRAGA